MKTLYASLNRHTKIHLKTSLNIYISFSLILCFIFNSCTNQSVYHQIDSEIQTPSSYVNYKVNEKGNIHIEYPIGLPQIFQNLILTSVCKDWKFDYCYGGNKSNVNILYRLGHVTEKLLSIKKEVHIMYCHPSDIVTFETLNYLLINENIHQIELNKNHSDIRHMIDFEIDNVQDQECQYDGDYSWDLFIKNNKPHIFVDKDKVCHFQFPFKLMEEMIIIKP